MNMRYFFFAGLLIIAIAVVLAHPVVAQAPGTQLAPLVTPSPKRLVVFEALMRPT